MLVLTIWHDILIDFDMTLWQMLTSVAYLLIYPWHWFWWLLVLDYFTWTEEVWSWKNCCKTLSKFSHSAKNFWSKKGVINFALFSLLIKHKHTDCLLCYRHSDRLLISSGTGNKYEAFITQVCVSFYMSISVSTTKCTSAALLQSV